MEVTMKKITLWLLVAMLIAAVFCVTGCRFIQGEDNDVLYELDSEGFDSTVVFGESVKLDGLKIVKTENGTATDIPVDASMITTAANTSKVGATELKITYEGHTFTVPVSVKYRVILKVDGEVLDTLYVMTGAELADITAPEKSGYVFAGWDPEIPGTLDGNLTLEATYTEAVPALTALYATYGDKLGDIALPSNAAGKWVFNTPEATVGDAGVREAAVSFVLNSGSEVLKTGTVKITVAKRTVRFTDVVTSFVYNGAKQIPTYTADADVDIIFFEETGSNYTDAGTYSYYFEVDDPNYEGELEGTYEITKADVTVKINSYTILASEAFPEITYTVSGFANASLLGLTVTDPDDVVTGAGIYNLTATASNPNVNLTVEPGTLTVVSTVLDVGAPTLSSQIAIYEDKISTITLGSHPNGIWTWQNPNATVGDVGTRTHVAVFTPNDTRYDTLTYNVDITVAAKPLNINVVQNVFAYTGSDIVLEYSITDNGGKVYDLEVLGNTPVKNVGTYTRTLTFANVNYTSNNKNVTVVVNKANPATNFGTTLSTVWSSTLKLADIALDAGYTWVNPDEKISKAGKSTYTATYTPADTDNYNVVTGTFTIDAEKAVATIANVNNSYNFTYNGNNITLSGIVASHEEAELEFTYVMNSATVEAIKNAGTYTVTVTLPETDNYKAASATTTVTVSPANNTDDVTLYQNATYGDKLSVIKLPTSTVGTWSWKGASAGDAVGNAGENKFTAIFTPADENYNAREVIITVTVARKKIDAPSISEEMRKQSYTGATLYSGLTSAEGYTVTDEGGKETGAYNVYITLDKTNYVWSDGSEDNLTLTYEIVAAANAWTVAPTIKSTWVFGDTDALDKNSAEYREYLGYAEALFGTVTVTYAPAGSNSFSEELPTGAGKYVARFTATHPDAATKSEDIPFEITKKAVAIPTYTDTYVYTGAGINAGITAIDGLYTVTDELKTDAGSYSARITLVAPANYVWADGDTNASKNLPYTISKATATIDGFSIGSIKFGETLDPKATVSLGAAYRFLYSTSIDGEYTEAVPTAVGTYFVKVSVLGNENIVASESAPIEFSIGKADVTLSGYKASYEKTYDRSVFVITGVTASNGAAVKISAKMGGADAEMLNAGTYTVTLYTEENESYNASSVTVTVTINAAENTDTVKTSQNATYGDKLSSLELPTSTNGVWVWTLMDENATVGGAGVNTFTALFQPANDNYKSREVNVTVTVAKATVAAPTPSHSVYDGAHHNSGIAASELYTVSDNGGEDKGTYVAVITLKDPANYKWDSSEEATLYIEYYISEAVNSWVSEPAVKTPVEYESTDNLASAEAEHGDVLIEYKSEGEDDGKYTTTAPTLPGKYVVRFTTTDENYTKLTAIKTIEITKKKITAPTVSITEFVYTGEKFTLGLAASDYYTVTDEGSINASASLTATLTLNSEYYVWADGTEGLTKVYTYSVIPADNTVTAPTIEGWTYGEEAKSPAGSTDSFGLDVSYVYSATENGEYTEAVPENAGTYYVKAITAATANVNAGESAPVKFTVSKAAATIGGYAESYTKTYDSSAFTFDDKGITASNGVTLVYAITKDGENVSAIKNAGIYTVTITLSETANYLGDEVVVTVTVNKIENTDSIPTYTATFGDKLSTLTPPTSLTGDWRWKDITDTTTVGNAGAAEHTLVFTPDDTVNYASREVTVTVTVAKMPLTSPVTSSISYVYANVTYTAGLVDTDLYTVTDEGGIAVGTYTATLTLKDSANYVWADGTDTLSITYEITEGTNEITSATIGSWVYGETASTGSATVKYGDIVITYKAEGEDDSKYTATVPTNAGNYIARFTTTDANCPIISVTRTFTIEKATVNVPAASNVYYNGSAQTGGIASGDIYTVVGEGGVNVGTYTVTLTLNDKNNYKWNTTGNSSDVTVSFEILKNTITFSNLSAGWTYGNPKEPTVTLSEEFAFAAQYVTFLYSTDGGATWSAEKPTEVGTYKVTLSSTSENFAFTDREMDFTIDRATPAISTPSIAGGKFYMNQLTLSTAGLTATNAGVNVTGTFAFSNLTFGDGTNASSVDLTFTPDNTTNYKPVTITYNLTLVSVAYLDNSTAYGTVEDAVQAANIKGSGTVWVRPHDPELGPIVITGYDKEIDGKTVKVLEINSGVTLLLPYGTDSSGRNSINSKNLPTVSLNGETGPSLALYDDSMCITKVLVSANVQIITSGILEISGQLSGGAMGTNYAGHTAGSYAKLILGSGASVTAEKESKIYCSGFIVEETKGNGSLVTINHSATLYQPFVICDYIDGNYMKAAQGSMKSNAIAPYNRFMFMNVTPTIRYNYGSALAVWAALYTKTTNNNNQTSVHMIGSPEFASDGVIQLSSKEYSYIIAKFDIDTQICDLDVYGGAYTKALEMVIPTGLGNTEVSTDDCLFQISYLFNVSLNKSEGQSSALYELGQRFKLLPGAVFTVGEGVTLDIRDLIVYETFNDTHHSDPKYLYPQKSPATFTVYGKFICEKFGGKIYAGSAGAVIVIEQAATYTAYEVGAYEAALLSSKVTSFITITLDAVLVGYDGTVAVGNYRSTSTGWEIMTIYFDTDGGSTVNNIWVDFNDITKYPTLPTTLKTGYAFLGWYLGDVLVNSGDDLLSYSTHTLTAHWEKITWITLDTTFDDINNEFVYVDLAVSDVYPSLPTLEKIGYTFLGWYYGDTEVKAGDTLMLMEDHVLTAHWRRHAVVTFDPVLDALESSVAYVDVAASDVYPNLPTLEKIGYTFLGWYYGDTEVKAGDTLMLTEDHILTAHWRRHAIVTFDPVLDGFESTFVYIDYAESPNYPTVSTLEKAGYIFLGWYYGDTEVKSGNSLLTSDDHTLEAKWKKITVINLDANGGSVAADYVNVDLDTDTAYPTLPVPTRTGYTFAGWYYGDILVDAGTALQVSGEHTIIAAWTINTYTITIGTCSNATVTAPSSAEYGSTVTITISYSKSSNKTVTVKDASGATVASGSDTTLTFTMPASNVTITASSSSSCVTPDTLVTLADGTQKRIDSVKAADMLLVWNFYTGKYDVAPASILINHGYDTVEILTLVFADGTKINTINGHGFFDADANKFVIIKTDNVADYVGKDFIKQDGDGYETVTLTNFEITESYTEVWSILTAEYYNCILEGMWTVTEAEVPNSPTYIMPYEVGEDMKYDEAKMQADIEKYGLYTYEDFAEYCSYEAFVTLGLENFKVSVGKGYITFDEIVYLLGLHAN